MGFFPSESVLNILELILAGSELSEVLTIIAGLVESQADGMLCTIWLPDADGKHLHCAAAPSLPEFAADIERMSIGPKGGSCGTAVYRREPVYVADILRESIWDDYRHLFLPYGIRAVWSRPLFTREGEVLGTFAILYREVRNPDALDLQLIENASQIASIAIERHISEEARAFIKLNCAAIPLGLLESELFGHEKGAFTGAIAQKMGRFELANKGTLFLDEVGDIPLELQAKLVRVLHEQEFERLGSNRTHKVNVRLIAATHRDLFGMVNQSTFREDLYYRLKVFPINVPALRQRTEDIPKLVRHFTEIYARRMNRRINEISSETMDALVRYPWPGNVRELQNFIERAVILSPHSVLRAPTSELEPFHAHGEANIPMTGLEEVERDHIVRALEASNWVVGGRNGAAERLGMKRTSLVYRMRKLRISRPTPFQKNGRPA